MRYRTKLTNFNTGEKNRAQNCLTVSNIQLASVVSDVFGKSSTAIWWLSKFCEGDIEDEEFKRHIIDLLVNSVTVWDEPDGTSKITAIYNLTSHKSKTFKLSGGLHGLFYWLFK